MNCLELQELFALEALGALDRVGQARLTALLALDMEAAAEAPAWRDTVAAFAVASVPRRRAPGALRERILARISHTPQNQPALAPSPKVTMPAVSTNSSLPALRKPTTSTAPTAALTATAVSAAPATARPPMTFDFGASAIWTTLPGLAGVQVRVLAVNQPQGYRVLQAKLAPGASFPAHHHGAGPEDLYILSGDLFTEGRLLGPGDHFHAEPGTDHHQLISPNGCQAILVEPLVGAEYGHVMAQT